MNLQPLSGTSAPASYACVFITRSFRRCCQLLAVLFFACFWHCSSHPLWVRSFTRCGSALVASCGSALLASCLLDHPTLSLLTSHEYSSALLRSCLSITSCVTLSWRSMNCLVANGSPMSCARPFACCAWSAGLTSTTVLLLRARRVKMCGVGAHVLCFRIHVVLLLWWPA